MDYLDARQKRTQRVIEPLHVRRTAGELTLVAYCQLRNDRRTFKVDRIVQLTRIDATTPVPPAAQEPCTEGVPDVPPSLFADEVSVPNASL